MTQFVYPFCDLEFGTLISCQADFAENLLNHALLKMTKPENRYLPIAIIHAMAESSIAQINGLAGKAFWFIRYEGICNGIEGLGLMFGSGVILAKLKTSKWVGEAV